MRLYSSTESRRYAVRSPDHHQTRGDSHLLVWGGIPHWMVVDDEYLRFLRALRPDQSCAQVLLRNGLAHRRRQLLAEVDRLKQLGIVSDAEAPPPPAASAPDTLPRIENLAVFVSHRCNLRCRFCYALPMLQARDDGVLSGDDLVAFLNGIRDLVSDNFSLFLLGGEPLLAPEVTLQLAEYARSRRWPCLVSTNGQQMTREFAAQARRTRLQVQVSLDSPDPEAHERLRGPGTYRKALAAIRLLREERACVVMSMVCHEGNLTELEAYYDLALQLGVQEARFIPLKLLGGACAPDAPRAASLCQLILAARELFRRRPELRKLAGRDAFSILAATCRLAAPRPSCGAGTQTLLLDADGSLYPCLNLHHPAMKFGNLKDPGFDFRRRWHDASVLRHVREAASVTSPGNACAPCFVRHWCLGGCHGETFSRHGGLNRRADQCADLKHAILEMFWVLAEDPHTQRQTAWHC